MIDSLHTYSSIILSEITRRAPTVAGAIITLVVWLRAISKAWKLIKKWFQTSHLDQTVSSFLVSMIIVILKLLLLISVASMFGVETTSLVALLWAAWLAIGLALQWSLANFAGGILTLIFKPYVVGDFIETQGVFGRVLEIQMFVTKLRTPENKIALVPNGPIANGNVINHSTLGEVMVDVHVWVWYDEDLDQCRNVLTSVINTTKHVQKNHPSNGVFVHELADSSVNLFIRAHARPEHYRQVYFALTEWAKQALDAAHISIPFPQRVVRAPGE